jgi:hypothetical protein
VSRRVIGPLVVIAAAGMLLTGCVVTPPDPTQPPTSTPTPSPSAAPATAPPTTAPIAPEPSDTVVAHITVRPEHLDLVNSAGIVVAELSYDADADVFVDTISTVLGGPPGVEERPGGHEWHPTTHYTWPGMEVIDDHEPSGYQADMNVGVRFTHPIVGDGISVSTVQGFRPGDDLRALADQLGEEWHEEGWQSFPAETGAEIGERGYDAWNDTYWEYANAYAVDVSKSYAPQPDVTSVVSAPWNFGIGHV